MRIPSLTSLSPKSVRTRFGNRSRTSSTSSTSTAASGTSVRANKPTMQRRLSGLNLYELLYSGSGGRTGRVASSSVGYWYDEAKRKREEEREEEEEEEEEAEEGLSVLEPRPRYCVGLFEVLEL